MQDVFDLVYSRNQFLRILVGVLCPVSARQAIEIETRHQ